MPTQSFFWRVSRILAYKTHDGYTEGMDPTFKTPWNSFVLTLPKFNIEGIDGIEVINENDVKRDKEWDDRKGGQKKIDAILQLLRDNPTITRNDLAKAVGISPSAIQKHINRLKANNTIVRRGGDRGGFREALGK